MRVFQLRIEDEFLQKTFKDISEMKKKSEILTRLNTMFRTFAANNMQSFIHFLKGENLRVDPQVIREVLIPAMSLSVTQVDLDSLLKDEKLKEEMLLEEIL
jgi:hypothetical protein